MLDACCWVILRARQLQLRFRSYYHRRNNGQALAEGAVGIAVVCTLGLLVLFLLLDSFLTMFYRAKLQLITLESAQYLANLPQGANLQQETEKHASDLLKQFGMSLATSPTCERKGDYAVVTLSANPPGLLGSSGLFLPVISELTDTEISTPPSNKAVGWLRLEWHSYGPGDIAKPGGPDSAIYVPILSLAQTDCTKRTYMMLDTAYWPHTHVIYHAAYNDFPNFRGPTGGTFIETHGALLSNPLLTTSLGGGAQGLLESLLAVYPPPPSGSSMFPYPIATGQQKITDCLGTPPAILPTCGSHWESGRWHFQPEPTQARILAQPADRFRDALAN